MLLGDYKQIAIDPKLVRHPDRNLRMMVNEAQQYRGVGAMPTFTQNVSLHDAMTEYLTRFEMPKLGAVKYLGLMSGVGGGALAAVGAGADPQQLVLNDVCEHHCNQLQHRFPEATVVCGDIKSATTQAKLLQHKGCLLYTSPSPRDGLLSRMPSSA